MRAGPASPRPHPAGAASRRRCRARARPPSSSRRYRWCLLPGLGPVLGPHPCRVGSELPRPRRSSASMTSRIVADRGLRLVVLDRGDRLDAAVQVAVHPVGRADVGRAAAVLELQMRACSRKSPMMDRTRMVAGRPAGRAGAGRVPRMMRSIAPRRSEASVEGVDDRAVDDRVDLGDDASAVAPTRVGRLHAPRSPGSVAGCCSARRAAGGRSLARRAGQDVEQVGDVRADLRSAVSRPRSS